MKSLERRIVRLERARRPEMPHGILYDELCLLAAIQTIWPDLETAPNFLQAEYRSLAVRCRGMARI